MEIYGKIGKTVIMHIIGHCVVFLSFPVSFTPTGESLILSKLYVRNQTDIKSC